MAGAVYWIGADGNIYTKGKPGEVGVHNEGAAAYPGDTATGYATTKGNSGSATRISDPNAPAAAGAAAPAGGGGGSSAPVLPDKSGDISFQNAALGQLDAQGSNESSAVAKALSTILGNYDTEAANNTGKYTAGSQTNQDNLQKNKQTSLVNGAQGRQGLFATLAAIGALNGSGITLANNAVQHGVNTDLDAGNNAYGSNQSALDTSIADFRAADKERRADAQTSADNQNTNIANDVATNKVKTYQALANDYSDEGDSANAQKYQGLAAGLLPTISATSIPATPLQPEAAAFQAPSLATYVAGTNPSSVSTTPGTAATGGIPGLVQDPTKKKQAVVPVPTT